jgi:hypothetical protein
MVSKSRAIKLQVTGQPNVIEISEPLPQEEPPSRNLQNLNFNKFHKLQLSQPRAKGKNIFVSVSLPLFIFLPYFHLFKLAHCYFREEEEDIITDSQLLAECVQSEEVAQVLDKFEKCSQVHFQKLLDERAEKVVLVQDLKSKLDEAQKELFSVELKLDTEFETKLDMKLLPPLPRKEPTFGTDLDVRASFISEEERARAIAYAKGLVDGKITSVVQKLLEVNARIASTQNYRAIGFVNELLHLLLSKVENITSVSKSHPGPFPPIGSNYYQEKGALSESKPQGGFPNPKPSAAGVGRNKGIKRKGVPTEKKV